jgi:large subunit ribosomal protein L4
VTLPGELFDAKPYRQKGTGRARQGSTRAPQFSGGGTVHGPQPRSYEQRTPKKMKAAALRGALSDRARAGRVHVVDGLAEGDRPSTKAALAALQDVVASRKVLVVLERGDTVTWLSLRNEPSVHLLSVDQLNTYDVLVSDDVVFTKGAFDAFVAGPQAGRSVKAVATSSEAPAAQPVSQPVSQPVTRPVTQTTAEPATQQVSVTKPIVTEPTVTEEADQ